MEVRQPQYFRFVIKESVEMDDDVTHRIMEGWMKWRQTSEILLDALVQGS